MVTAYGVGEQGKKSKDKAAYERTKLRLLSRHGRSAREMCPADQRLDSVLRVFLMELLF